ncbi:MAG: iron-sulfur cluster assembly protein [Acidimicrobiales bacterium]
MSRRGGIPPLVGGHDIGAAIELSRRIDDALETVDDPEYPGVSIVALGMFESMSVQHDDTTGKPHVTISLVPTFAGCPALGMIADDVRQAVAGAVDAESVAVEWRSDVAWSTDRISADAEQALAQEFTVVLRGADGTLRCPVCGHDAVTDQSMAGPTRCRSVAWCPDCRNPVEVFRA